MARSYSNSIFNFFRNFHTDFLSGWTNLHSDKQCISVPLSWHPCQHLLIFVFLIIAILIAVRWNTMLFQFSFSWWLKMLNISSAVLYISSFLLFFFFSTGVWTQGLDFEPLHQPFLTDGLFRDRVFRNICPDWLWTTILLISASWVAGITDMNHQCLTCISSFKKYLIGAPSLGILPPTLGAQFFHFPLFYLNELSCFTLKKKYSVHLPICWLYYLFFSCLIFYTFKHFISHWRPLT
jgi:hypothetical protein